MMVRTLTLVVVFVLTVGPARAESKAQIQAQIQKLMNEIALDNAKREQEIANVSAKYDKLIQKEQGIDNKDNDKIKILEADKAKAIAKINAHHDKHVAELNHKIALLQKKLMK